jgi:hypothetical protein
MLNDKKYLAVSFISMSTPDQWVPILGIVTHQYELDLTYVNVLEAKCSVENTIFEKCLK